MVLIWGPILFTQNKILEAITPYNPFLQDLTKKEAEIVNNIQTGVNDTVTNIQTGINDTVTNIQNGINNIQTGINDFGNNIQTGINDFGNNIQSGINENLWKVGLFAAAVLIIGGGVIAGGRQVGKAIGNKL